MTIPDHVSTTTEAAVRAVHAKQRVTLVGAIANLLLAIAKISVGAFAHSEALVADGIHSAADLASDGLVWWAVRAGGRRADSDHPYGHARIETAATMLVSLFLLLAAGLVSYDAVRVIISTEPFVRPGWPALAVAAVGLASKEGLYWYTLRVARQARSQLIEANAWHHRSDAMSSVAALIAIAGAMSGIPGMDALGAIAIAIMLAAIGLRYAWRSLQELVDTGLRPERIGVVRDEIRAVPGVRRMRRLRTRTMGGHDAFADVEVLVDPYISLTEAHRISEAISARLVDRVEEISDICVHVEPDGHADARAAHTLPLREKMLPALQQAWRGLPVADAVTRVVLHYVDESIEIDLYLPLREAAYDRAHQAAFDRVAAQIDAVARIRLFYSAAERSGRGYHSNQKSRRNQ